MRAASRLGSLPLPRCASLPLPRRWARSLARSLARTADPKRAFWTNLVKFDERASERAQRASPASERAQRASPAQRSGQIWSSPRAWSCRCPRRYLSINKTLSQVCASEPSERASEPSERASRASERESELARPAGLARSLGPPSVWLARTADPKRAFWTNLVKFERASPASEPSERSPAECLCVANIDKYEESIHSGSTPRTKQ